MVKVRHDGGGGITDISKKHFSRTIRGVVPIEVNIHRQGIFTFELYGIEVKTSDCVVILESGFNCGYGGTGPHGSAWALENLGMAKEVSRCVFEQMDLRVDFRDMCIVVHKGGG